MNMWMMYLVLKLDLLTGGLIVIPIITIGLSLFILGSVYVNDYGEHEDTKKVWKFTKKVLIFAIFPLLLGVLIPNTKQAAMIYFVPKVINNKQIQKMPAKLVTLANDWMDEQIKQTKGKIKGKNNA